MDRLTDGSHYVPQVPRYRRTHMSHIMRKPVYSICEKQRCRSACTSAQSDQHLCFRCLDSIIPLVSITEISSLYLASVAAQAGLSLPGSKIPKTDFLVKSLISSSSHHHKRHFDVKQVVLNILSMKRILMQPHSLISVFVIRCLASIMPLISISEISSL